MLIIFKSKASSNVIMFGDVAMQLLEIMGKSQVTQGIITIEQLPDAIASLKRAATASKAQATKEDERKLEKTHPGIQPPFVSLAARTVPLIELLEHSLKAKVPVLWGN